MSLRLCGRQQSVPNNFPKTERLEFYPRNDQIQPDLTHDETTLVIPLDDILLDGYTLRSGRTQGLSK